MAVLRFNFIRGLNLIFLYFKIIIIDYHTYAKVMENKYELRIKLNHNSYSDTCIRCSPYVEDTCVHQLVH